MTKLGYAFALGSAALVTSALLVKPPVSPPPAGAKAAARTALTSGNPAPQVGGALTTSGGRVTTSPAVAPQGAATAPTRKFAVDVIAVAAWGTGPTELGRMVPSEASPEAPMALTVGEDGLVHVLDQLNRRVQVYDQKGTVVRSLSIPLDTAQDVALDPVRSGSYVLLDRWVQKAVVFVDDRGTERTRVPLLGQGVDEAGGVTALFSARDGAWVEYDHQRLVRVALPNGDPDLARKTYEGRRVPGGSLLLRAARDPSGFAVVSAFSFGGPGGGGGNGYLARVAFGAPVMQLEGLEADASGTTYVAAHLYREGPKLELLDQRVVVVALSPTGAELGRFELPASEGAEMQLRPFAVSSDGAVFHLHVSASGATIRRAR